MSVKTKVVVLNTKTQTHHELIVTDFNDLTVQIDNIPNESHCDASDYIIFFAVPIYPEGTTIKFIKEETKNG